MLRYSQEINIDHRDHQSSFCRFIELVMINGSRNLYQDDDETHRIF